MKGPRVFVAGPFSAARTDLRTGGRTRQCLEGIIAVVERAGGSVFSSHLTEEWGAVALDSLGIVRRDLTELEECSHVILYSGPIVSFGALIETGYALKSGKRILILIDESILMTSEFVEGLVLAGNVRTAPLTDMVEAIPRFLATQSDS